VVERVSGRSLASLLQEIVEAAGLEQSFHCACDKDFVPITSGGGYSYDVEAWIYNCD